MLGLARVLRKPIPAPKSPGTQPAPKREAAALVQGAEPETVVRAIRNELQRYSRTLEAIASQERQERQRRTRKRLNGPGGLVSAFARLRDNMVQPLRAVYRDDGSITADPDGG